MKKKKIIIIICLISIVLFLGIISLFTLNQKFCYNTITFIMNPKDANKGEKFEYFPDYMQNNFFQKCIELQNNSNSEARVEMLWYLQAIANKYPNARDIAVVNYENASQEVKGVAIRILLYGGPQIQLLSHKQAKKNIDVFLKGIHDEHQFVREASVIGLIIAKYDDIPFLKKHLQHLFNDKVYVVRQTLISKLTLYTGIEPWRKKLQNHLKDETEKYLIDSINWKLSDKNASQIIRQRALKLNPNLKLPPLSESELKPNSSNPKPQTP